MVLVKDPICVLPDDPPSDPPSWKWFFLRSNSSILLALIGMSLDRNSSWIKCISNKYEIILFIKKNKTKEKKRETRSFIFIKFLKEKHRTFSKIFLFTLCCLLLKLSNKITKCCFWDFFVKNSEHYIIENKSSMYCNPRLRILSQLCLQGVS